MSARAHFSRFRGVGLEDLAVFGQVVYLDGERWVGPLGSTTIVHTHPGTEALYTLVGELCLRTLDGVVRVPAGRGVAGPAAGMPTQVSSCGSTDLRGFVILVVDATNPFSTASIFP